MLANFSHLARRLVPQLVRSPVRSVINIVKNEDELFEKLEENEDKLLVVYWTAKWCGPCKQVGPVVQGWSDDMETFPNVAWIKCDVDEMQSTAMEAGIGSVPTFHIIHDEEKLDEVVGGDIPRIRETVSKHHEAIFAKEEK